MEWGRLGPKAVLATCSHRVTALSDLAFDES